MNTKTSIELPADKDDEVRHYGAIENTPEALDKVIKKLEANNRTLNFVYEAGPCGYQIYRHLTSAKAINVWWPRLLLYPGDAATVSKCIAAMP